MTNKANDEKHAKACELAFLISSTFGPLAHLTDSDPQLIQRLYTKDPIKLGEVALNEKKLRHYINEERNAWSADISRRIEAAIKQYGLPPNTERNNLALQKYSMHAGTPLPK